MQLTYPGVYVQELSSGVHSIAGVATSIAAFVGYTASGPDGLATALFSFADYQRNFGGLASDSELSYAVQQFFTGGGTQCYVVRVPRTGSARASLSIAKEGDATTDILDLQAISTGSWANSLVVAIDINGLPTTAANTFNLTITNTATGASESFPGVSTSTSSPNYVSTIVNDPHAGSMLVRVTNVGSGEPARPGIIGVVPATALTDMTVAGKAIGLSAKVGAKTYKLALYAASDPRPVSLAAVYQQIAAKLTRALQPDIPGAQVTASTVKSTVAQATANAVQLSFSLPGAWDAPVSVVADASDIDAGKELALNVVTAGVAGYWFGGKLTAGTYEKAVTNGDDSGTLPGLTGLLGDPLAFTGLYALDKVDLFNLLAFPDLTRAGAGTPNTPALGDSDINGVYAEAMAYCIKRRAFLLLDCPPDVIDVASAINWKTSRLTVHDLNGATYFPRLRLADQLNQGQLRTFAPCGVVAGLYANIDGNRGVWKAPAGTEAVLTGVQTLVYTLSDAENGAINPLGLNCFRTFPIYGNVCWGARTLVGSDAEASDWKYIPVRRLALYMEESLYRGLQWAVFEPNDEGLWSQIRLNVNGFLSTLYRQGAFQGSTPAQAYFVVCDSTTTTQTDIDNGAVNILVGFAPVKPAEFVVLKLQQIAGQTTS